MTFVRSLWDGARERRHASTPLENSPREEVQAAKHRKRQTAMLESLLQHFLSRSTDNESTVNQQPMDPAALDEKGEVVHDADMDEWVLLGTTNEAQVAAKSATRAKALTTQDRSYADVVAGRPSPRKANA